MDDQHSQIIVPKEKKRGIFFKAWRAIVQWYRESMRVLKVTKKPDKEEFNTIVKITGLGMAVIGFVGFVVHLIKELFF